MNQDSKNLDLSQKTLVEFHKILQSSKIYNKNNTIVIKCINNFFNLLNEWWTEDESLTIKLSRGRLLVQDYKIPYSNRNQNMLKELHEFLEIRGIQGISFKSLLKNINPVYLFYFARILHLAQKNDEPLDWIVEKLKKNKFVWVEIIEQPKSEWQKQDFLRKQIARKTYAYAVSSLKEVSFKINNNQIVGVRKLKRIAQNMVDILSEDESILLGVSTIRDYDDYTYTHSVNVAILSLCLGKRIGLSKMSLSHLVICGLVHDLGKIEIPKEILNKNRRLDDEEWKIMRSHVEKSIQHIIKLQAPLELKTKILLPPFEHHLRYDLSGYPKIPNKKNVSLFGRILTITDVFDALTSPRIYRPIASSPDLALAQMIEKSGKDFDPILLKVFINMVGVYPIGTLLKLDTGEFGLVTLTSASESPTRPYIVLLKRTGDGKYRKKKTVDLSETDPKTGLFKRNILNSCHPSVFGIQAMDYIL